MNELNERSPKPVKKWVILENLGEINTKTLQEACAILALKSISIEPSALKSFLYRELPQGGVTVANDVITLNDLPENLLPITNDKPGALTRAKNTGIAWSGRPGKSYTEPRD